MHDKLVWQNFFNVDLIFEKLQIDCSLNNVVGFGSGYGTFSIPAAKIIEGNSFTFISLWNSWNKS